MYKKFIYICCFVFMFSNVYAYDCVGNGYLFSRDNSNDEIKLRYLSNCSWVKDAQRVNIRVFTSYDGDFYADSISTDKNSKFINGLNKQIEKTIMNELYFTNWKYTSDIELENFKKMYYNYNENKNLKSMLAERIIDIHVSLELYRYNKNTDLHYGNIKLTITPSNFIFSNPWLYKDVDLSSYLRDKEFKYEVPIAGYANSDKNLNTNICNQISYWMSDSFQKLYTKITSNTNYSKTYSISNFNYKYDDNDELLGMVYLKKVNNTSMKLELNKNKLFSIPIEKLNTNSSDDEIKRIVDNAFDENYKNLKVLVNDTYNEAQKEFENYYMPEVKKYLLNK